MKVIYTGFSKCGTKSMAEALRHLGLNVHDFMQQYEFNGDNWIKMCKEGLPADEIRKMLDGVDAVTDMPAYAFWEQILEAYPDAKIIHCERDSEDEWYKSFDRQMRSGTEVPFINKLIGRLSFFYAWPFVKFCYEIMIPTIGFQVKDSLWTKKIIVNEQVSRMMYRKHNSYVRNNAPKDKLLIWKLSDGWKPICEFLNLPVPDIPYPHNNKKASLWDDMAKTNKTFQKMGMEGFFNLFLLTILTAYGVYKLCSCFN